MSANASSDLFLFYVEGVVLTSVATFGLVGTLMSIYVLVQPKVCLDSCFFTCGVAGDVCELLRLLVHAWNIERRFHVTRNFVVDYAAFYSLGGQKADGECDMAF